MGVEKNIVLYGYISPTLGPEQSTPVSGSCILQVKKRALWKDILTMHSFSSNVYKSREEDFVKGLHVYMIWA